MNAEEADEKGIEDMASLELAMPGLAQAVKTFFTVYKVPSLYLLLLSELFHQSFLAISLFRSLLQVPAGAGENKFAYGGEIQGKQLAEEVAR